jgi:hypothetical protein
MKNLKIGLIFAALIFMAQNVLAEDPFDSIHGIWQIEGYAGSVRGSHYETVCGDKRIPVSKYFLNGFEFSILPEKDGSFSFAGEDESVITGRYFEGAVDFVFPDKDLKLEGVLAPGGEVIFVEGTYEICGGYTFAISFQMKYLGEG